MSDDELVDSDGIEEDEAYAKGVEVDGLESFLAAIRDLIERPDQIPLAPINFGGQTVEGAMHTVEGLLADQWLVANTCVICFGNSSNGNRHIALTTNEYRDFWVRDPRAKAHLRTQVITSYPFTWYWEQMLKRFRDSYSQSN